MRVAYFADDGTEFEFEKECREYEKRMSNILVEWKNSIHAYSYDGNIIDLEEWDVEELEYVFELINYIQFDTQKAIDCFMGYAIHEFGLVDIACDICRDVKPGERYFYDDYADEWICLEDKQKELDKIAAVFK